MRLMDYNVTVTRQPDGTYSAACAELPEFWAAGDTADECDTLVLGTIWVFLPEEQADMTSANAEVRLCVKYQGLPPEEALKRNWELFLPRHVHDEL